MSKKHSSQSIRTQYDRSKNTKQHPSGLFDQQKSTKTVQTVRELLTAEPVVDRFEYMQSNYIEFMSYLRPLMKDNMNTSAENSGWGFLTKHVCCNPQLFRTVLQERNRLEALQQAREENNRLMQKQLTLRLSQTSQAPYLRPNFRSAMSKLESELISDISSE